METRFITVFTTAFHWSLVWTKRIHTTPKNVMSLKVIYFIILSSMAKPSKWFCSSVFPIKTLYVFLFSVTGFTYSDHLLFLCLITRIIFGELWKSWSFLEWSSLHSHVISSLLGPKAHLLQHPVLEHSKPLTLPLMSDSKFQVLKNFKSVNLSFCIFRLQRRRQKFRNELWQVYP